MASGLEPIAITGLGVVSCHGADLDAQRAAFVQGGCVLSEVDRSAGYHRQGGARHAALVDPACYRSILPPLKARRMSPPSRFGMVAARQALVDAGLEPEALSSGHGEDVSAVVFGTGFGPSSYSERILRQILLESPLAASPMLFTESVANAPASQVALALDCKGPNVTITQREASTLLAVAEGAALIRSGRARRALVGGVEELNPLLHAILDRFGALAGSRVGSGSDQARPLHARRAGFVASEGAAVLVLERLDDVDRRAGRPRALVGDVGRAFDPEAPVTGWSVAAPTVADRLQCEFRAQQSEPDSSPLRLVLGANGSRSHDRFEASLVEGLVERDTEVLVPKRSFGEQGMATLVGALLRMEGLEPASERDFEIDPEIGFGPSTQGSAQTSAAGSYLLSSVANGGACCWLGLESS